MVSPSSEHTSSFVWKRVVAGGLGGTVGAFFTHPLDVVRTRLQSSLNAASFEKVQAVPRSGWQRYTPRTFLSLGSIFRTEGMRGLFRGLIPNLVGVMPARAIYFTSYGLTKRTLTSGDPAREDTLTHTLSAISAAVVTSTAVSPLGVLKTRMQLSEVGAATSYPSYWACAKDMYKKEGFRSFYRGLTASYLGSSETALQFILYERFKAWVSESQGSEDKRPHSIWVLLTAATSKLIAASVTYPHEVVRTRMREGKTSENFVVLFRKVLHEEGWRSLYRGMAAHLMRVVPNTAIVFFTFEVLVQFLDGDEQATSSSSCNRPK